MDRTTRVLAGLIVLVLVAGAGYFAWTTYAVGRVDVAVGDPRCEGTAITPRGVVEARPGMDCRVRVTIRNRGPVDVQVGQVRLKSFGREGGAVVRADDTAQVDGTEVAVDGFDRDESNASVPLDRPLAAGGELVVEVDLVWRESGCNGGPSGGLLSIPRLVDVPTTYLGRDRTVSAGRFALTQAAPARGCRAT